MYYTYNGSMEDKINCSADETTSDQQLQANKNATAAVFSDMKNNQNQETRKMKQQLAQVNAQLAESNQVESFS